jgi:mono/diheme cytochrome c family protein
VILAACSKEGGIIAPTFQRMLVQKKYLPFDTSRFFTDGRTMRTPPAGTVPREQTVETATAASATTIPSPITSELLSAGQTRFNIFCAVCHGVLADGNSVVAKNMADCPPPSLLTPAVRVFPPGALYTIITNGFGRMPSYAPELPPSDRWAVIAYLRSLQQSRPAQTQPSAGPLPPLPPQSTDSVVPQRNTSGCGRTLMSAVRQP